jgi:hypothetical protein
MSKELSDKNELLVSKIEELELLKMRYDVAIERCSKVEENVDFSVKIYLFL